MRHNFIASLVLACLVLGTRSSVGSDEAILAAGNELIDQAYSEAAESMSALYGKYPGSQGAQGAIGSSAAIIPGMQENPIESHLERFHGGVLDVVSQAVESLKNARDNQDVTVIYGTALNGLRDKKNEVIMNRNDGPALSEKVYELYGDVLEKLVKQILDIKNHVATLIDSNNEAKSVTTGKLNECKDAKSWGIELHASSDQFAPLLRPHAEAVANKLKALECA